jgi:hypothetical protein
METASLKSWLSFASKLKLTETKILKNEKF